VFYIDVAKVDRDVAHVAMTNTHVARLCFKCFICFRRILQMFHLDVLKVHLVLHMLLWLYTHVSSVLSVFRRMLQVFNLDVSKVDLGEARVATATAPPGVTACLLCAFVCVKRSKLGVVLCMRGPVRPLERDGCGARELGASGAGARAPSDANISNRTSRRWQVSPY